MLEIREDQLAAMRAEVRAGLPSAMLDALRQKGIGAARERDGGAVAAVDPRGFTTRMLFNADGSPAALRFPSGQEYRLESDAEGRAKAIEHSGGARVELDYDGEGRITAVRRPGKSEHKFNYDAHGRLGALQYPDGRTAFYERDDAGNLLAAIDRTGARTEYQRDKSGKLTAIVDPLGRKLGFDLAGDALSAVLFPDGSREEYGYDAERQVGVIRLRDGSEVYQTLDDAGAVDSIHWSDGHYVEFDADQEGRIVAARTARDEVGFEYGADGELAKERTRAGVVRTGYDPEGRVTELRTPLGDTLGYAYDEDGRLATITDWEGRRHHFRYGDDGAVSEIRYGNGLVERQRYHPEGRLANAQVTGGRSRKPLSKQRYAYDINQRLTEVEDQDARMGWQRNVSYDAEGRITACIDANKNLVERFEYDAKGNIVRDGAVVRRIGALDEVLEIDRQAVGYDGLGNVTRLPTARGVLENRFAADCRLLETRLGDKIIHYEYDAVGRRTLKSDGVHTWRYGWSGHQLLWEDYVEAPDAKPVRRDYLWCPDSFVLVAFREGGRSYWVQNDTRGAPIRVFSEDRRIVWSARYDAFGRAEVDIAHVRQPFRLPGQYHDAETGLHYTLARYYSPEHKSFLSRDPQWIEPGATNYSYARNDPYNHVDPCGGLAFLAVALIAVAVGAAVGAISAAVTGGDPIAGAVGGAMTVVGAIVGGLVGGPVGMVAGGMIGGAAGAFTESVIEQARKGDPICWECAAKEAAISLGIDIALLGLGKIPIVKRLVRALGKKLASKGQAIKNWVKKKGGDVWKRIRPKADKVKIRQRDNKRLWKERGMSDADKVGVGEQDLALMRAHKKPIGFKSEAQYQQFQRELNEALKKDGLDDASVRMRGTSTTFYSENPKKPLGHHWDADPKAPGDFDLEVSSAKLSEKMSAGGYSAHPDIPSIYKTRHVMEQTPALKEFSDKWAGKDMLGREVNFVGLTSPNYASTSPSDFIVAGGH